MARLKAALNLLPSTTWKGKPRRLLFVVTGDVPYQPGSKTLGELMREYLIAAGCQRNEVLMATGATGSFAEPRLVTEMLAKLNPDRSALNLLVVVSSDWQLWVGRPFWKRCARQARFQLNFLPMLHSGGWRTRVFYAAFAAFSRLALAAGVWGKIEPFLYRKLYAPRAAGFKLKGCA